MKIHFAFLFLALNITMSQGQSVWTAKADYGGTGRNRACGFAIPSIGKGYVVGGFDGGYQHDVYEYDANADAWTAKAPYPGESTVQAAFSIGGKGYVGTGVSGGYTWANDFYAFDPVANTWTAMAPFPGAPRGYAVGFAIGNKGYIGGGFSGTPGAFVTYTDFYEYDPVLNSWSAVAPYPGNGAGLGAVAFAIGGKGYVGTGSSVDASGTQLLHDDFYEFDPALNVWTQKADYGGGARGEATAFSICDKGYIGLGYSVPHASFNSNFWQYDPQTDVWTPVASYTGAPRGYTPGFAIDSSGYAGTGFDGAVFYKDFREFHNVATAGFTTASASGTSICTGQTVSFTDTSTFIPTTWSWSFPGGTPSSSSISNPVITYNTTGSYDVVLTVYNNCDSASVTYADYVIVSEPPVPPDLGSDTSICGTISLTLDAGSIGYDYLWSTGDTLSSVVAMLPGSYWVQVSNACGALADTVSISQQTSPEVHLGNDTLYCNAFTRLLSVANGGSLIWSTGETSDTIIVTSPGLYAVTASGSCGVISDSIVLAQSFTPDPELPDDTSFCSDFSIVLDAGSAGFNYLWSTGETTSTISVLSFGSYVVNVTSECGNVSDTTNIFQQQLPFVFPGNDTLYCSAFNRTLAGTGDSFQWSTGANTPSIVVTQAGVYSVTLGNACGLVVDTIVITQSDVPDVRLPDDTLLCPFTGFAINATLSSGNYNWSTGATTSSIIISVPGVYSVTSDNECGSSSDSISVGKCYGSYVIPNAFSPNGDGLNDLLAALRIGVATFVSLSVYNRWGEIVFHANDEKQKWDGTFRSRPLQVGVYVYVLRYRDADGASHADKGNITLIR